MDVLIKNVDPIAWKSFKILALQREENIGELFSEVARNLETEKGNWKNILERKGTLSTIESEEIMKRVKEFRKGFDFR